MEPLRTARLTLVPGDEALAAAELADRGRFAALLGADVPADWPPESVRDALPRFLAGCRARGDCGPWTLGWYALLAGDGRPVLCGSIGFKGGPDAAGMVETGYSVLPAFQARGIAREMLAAMVAWALAQPGVRAVEAEALASNAPSLRVLEVAGFARTGAGRDPDTLRFRFAGTATR